MPDELTVTPPVVPPPPVTREASEVVRELGTHVLENANAAVANFVAMALKDAQLSPGDGWTYDFKGQCFVKVPKA